MTLEHDVENETSFVGNADLLVGRDGPLALDDVSLAEVEQVRLILRGGSVVDWHRLNLTSVEEASQILRSNEFVPDDQRDQQRLSDIRRRAIDYLHRNFQTEFAPEIVGAPRTEDLLLLAAGRDPVLQPQACMVLKLMHVINHIDGRELLFMLPVSDRDVFYLVEEKATRVADEMRRKGFPIVEFAGSRKSRDSLITKLLSKKQSIAAQIYDKLRFRIVTANASDVFPVLRYLGQELFPFNYTVPGESINTVFDFPKMMAGNPHLAQMIPSLQVDIESEDQMRPTPNEATSVRFRVINFVVDLPIRIDSYLSHYADPTLAALGRIVYVLTEFQVLDLESHLANERGEASHEKYKARQRAKVKHRLVRGKKYWGQKGEL
jgi:uncharacterized protein (TIGR04552 family)